MTNQLDRPKSEREQFAEYEAKLAADRAAVRAELRARAAKNVEIRRAAHLIVALSR